MLFIYNSKVYGIGIISPFLLASVLNFKKIKIDYSEAICFYGYSKTIFIPATLVCIIPYKII